jgi:hypothetical protein
MEQIELINQAAALINQASQSQGEGSPVRAQFHLTELRKLLNDQHELEAGGVQQEPASDAPEKKTEEASAE